QEPEHDRAATTERRPRLRDRRAQGQRHPRPQFQRPRLGPQAMTNIVAWMGSTQQPAAREPNGTCWEATRSAAGTDWRGVLNRVTLTDRVRVTRRPVGRVPGQSLSRPPVADALPGAGTPLPRPGGRVTRVGTNGG